MKTIRNLTTQLQPKSGGPSQSETHDDRRRALGLPVIEKSSKANLSESHFDRLWQRMAEVFGHRWTTSFGKEPNDSWRDGLADMTEDDIRFGLMAIKQGWKSEWPPNMLQFRALCRPTIDEAHKIHRRLPEPEEVVTRRKANGLAHVSMIRTLLDTKKEKSNA